MQVYVSSKFRTVFLLLLRSTLGSSLDGWKIMMINCDVSMDFVIFENSRCFEYVSNLLSNTTAAYRSAVCIIYSSKIVVKATAKTT